MYSLLIISIRFIDSYKYKQVQAGGFRRYILAHQNLFLIPKNLGKTPFSCNHVLQKELN